MIMDFNIRLARLSPSGRSCQRALSGAGCRDLERGHRGDRGQRSHERQAVEHEADHALGAPEAQIDRKVAQVVRAQLRRSDTFCRYGGEEFVVLMPASRETAHECAERIQAAVAGHGFMVSEDGPVVGLTLSVGVAVQPARKEIMDPHALVRAADEAVYQAKSEGRNRVVVAKPLRDG